MALDRFSLRGRFGPAASLFFVFASFVSVSHPRIAEASNGEVNSFKIHQPYVSPRAMGMGNAFTAVADDYSTMFYNPAGLSRLEEGHINLGLGANADSKVQKFVSDIDEVAKSDSVPKMAEFLQSNYGNHYSARVPTLNAFWVRPKWGLAVIPADLSLDLEIHQLGMASLGVVATQDTTIAYGRGWDVKWFGQDRVSLGVTAKAVYRAHVNKSVLASDLALDSKVFDLKEADEGFTVDADFGMLWTPKISSSSWWRHARPTVGFTVRNVADYGFTSNFHLIDKNSGTPPKLGRRFDVGTLFELPDWWVFKTRFAADLRDMGHDKWTFQKGSHLGAEFLWKIRSWWQGGWRVGLNQGYFTAGFTGRIGIFKLDLATSAEEIGTSTDPKSNRTYTAKASLDW